LLFFEGKNTNLTGAKEYTDEFLRQKTREEFYDEQKRKKTKKVSFVCFFKNTMKTKKIIFISTDIIIIKTDFHKSL